MITERIKLIREERGLTQAEMAYKLDMERSNYARLENRGESLTIAQLKAICNALDVSIHEVIDENNGHFNDTVKHQDTKEDIRKLKELKTENSLLRNFTNWVTLLFRDDFSAMKETLLKDSGQSEADLKSLGDQLFSHSNQYLYWSVFMARSGFINEKWFVDAYKRSSKRLGIKTNTSESINWINGVLDYISETDE